MSAERSEIQEGPKDPSRRRFLRRVGGALFVSGIIAIEGIPINALFLHDRRVSQIKDKVNKKYPKPSGTEVEAAAVEVKRFENDVRDLASSGDDKVPQIAGDPQTLKQSYDVLRRESLHVGELSDLKGNELDRLFKESVLLTVVGPSALVVGEWIWLSNRDRNHKDNSTLHHGTRSSEGAV